MISLLKIRSEGGINGSFECVMVDGSVRKFESIDNGWLVDENDERCDLDKDVIERMEDLWYGLGDDMDKVIECEIEWESGKVLKWEEEIIDIS